MTIDNPFQSPNAESPANLGEVLHSRNNWTGYSPGQPACEATPDGGFRINAEELCCTMVGPPRQLREDIRRQNQLLRAATTFECTGNTLVLSDDTPRNQLRYLARIRWSAAGCRSGGITP